MGIHKTISSPFPNDKYWTLPNPKTLQMTILNLMKMAEWQHKIMHKHGFAVNRKKYRLVELRGPYQNLTRKHENRAMLVNLLGMHSANFYIQA